MKFGIRKPSLKKRLAARTSLKRVVRHSLGFKAPRGWGWLTNPKRAAYNKVYNMTTVSVDRLLRGGVVSKGGKKVVGQNGDTEKGDAEKGDLRGIYIIAFILAAVFLHEYTGLFILVSIVLLFLGFESHKEYKAGVERDRLATIKDEQVLKEYGSELGDRMIDCELWVGATTQMVLEMFGAPAEIEDKYLVTKQRLVYKYFQYGVNRFYLRITLDDGLVTKWDDKRRANT